MIIQGVVWFLLAFYLVGMLYFLLISADYMIKRQRNMEISLIVDVSSKMVTALIIALFWPVHLFFVRE